MKKSNKINAVAAILFAVILLGGTALFLMMKSRTVPKKVSVKIYYYDPISMELIPETVQAELPENTVLKVKKIIELLKTPGQNGVFPVLSKETALNSVNVENGICTLDFNKEISTIKPYSVRKEAIRVYGIVNTLTELPDIYAVRITIDGQNVKYLSRYIEIDKPLAHLNSALPDGKDVFVYYASPDLSELVVQKRNVLSVQNPVELGKEILKELLNGPFGTTIPRGTKINDFHIKSGGTGVVDFSKEILEHSIGSQGEQTRVLAIVNSLTELPDIKSVKILVDGKEISTLYGSVDTSQPIPRFMGIASDPETAIPYFYIKINGETFLTPKIEAVEGKNRITELFELLKSPPENEGTYISKNSKIESFEFSGKDNSLILKISAPDIKDEGLPELIEQIKLSYLEFPAVSHITLFINGVKY